MTQLRHKTPLQFLIALALTALSGCNGVSPRPTPTHSPVTTQPAPNPSPVHILLAAPEVRVPLEFHNGIPYVRWKAADGTEAVLLIDTGSASVFISPRIAAAHSLAVRPSGTYASDPSGNSNSLMMAHVPALSLGPVQFEDFDALLIDQQDCDGLLGWPLFKDLLLTIDYANRAMVLKPGELPPPDGKDILSLTVDGGRLLIAGELDAKGIWLEIDTGWGTPSNVELTPDQVANLKWASPPVAMTSTGTSLGSVPEKLGRLQSDLHFGRHTISQPIVGINPGIGVGLLSASTLKKFTLTLDLKNRRVRFARPSTDAIRSPSVFVAGFKVDLSAERLKVTEVLPGSQAEHIGLKVGDLIESVNGQPARAGFMGTATNPISLDIRRGATVVHMTVPLTKLVL